jgi:allantoate deiminase
MPRPVPPITPSYGTALMQRLDSLAAITDEPGKLTRLYLSPAHVKAAAQVETWMREVGLSVRRDALGTVIGRLEGHTPGLPALVLASHIDTVRDAGRYDGNLGVLAAIAAVGADYRQGGTRDFAIEVMAFGDEENVRFPSRLLSSRAVTGAVEPTELAVRDADGTSVAEALPLIGGDATQLKSAERERGDILAYIELHIEQGPVLEARNTALGVVTSISGATRMRLTVTGEAGHAGTVPMALRRDALAAAAEMTLAVESLGRSTSDLVATVGQISATPGAVNVIPGSVSFSLDLRHPDDATRQSSVAQLLAIVADIAKRRHVMISSKTTYDEPAASADPRVMALLAASLERLQQPIVQLPSGAGHDAMAIAKRWPMGMLFLRCKGGISHNPAESITTADADLAVRALVDVVRNFDPNSFA